MPRQTLFFSQALLPQGWSRDVEITLDGARIARVAPDSKRQASSEAHALALPALSNLHSHAFQRGMAGETELRGSNSDSFWTWRDFMYRFVHLLDPEDAEAVAAQAYVEMLESGFTRVGEFHYLHHDRNGNPYENIGEMAHRIAAAALDSGIGLTLLPVFYAHANFGGAAPAPLQRRFINDVDSFTLLVESCERAVAQLPHGRSGIAPHSLRAVTPAELKEITPLTRGPLHIHAAEQTKEVDDCIAWGGMRPIEWLLKEHGLNERWCVIHATHMTEDETRSLAQSGATVGLCPITEANLGDGIFNLPSFIVNGGSYCVGTDSNVLIDAAAELRQLEYSQRLATRARNVAATNGGSTGRALFEAALVGGDKALGHDKSALAEGSLANIVTLDINHPAMAAKAEDSSLDGWIFASSGGIIDCVWSLGRKVVRNGRHISRERVASRFRKTMGKLLC